MFNRVILVIALAALAGCEVIDPGKPTTLSPIPAVGSMEQRDAVRAQLTLPYPAPRVSERHQVPVGAFLASRLAQVLPGVDVQFAEWQPSAEVRGTFGPHVVLSLGFRAVCRTEDGEFVVADFVQQDVGNHHVAHLSLTGFHSLDSHEVPGPIHKQLSGFLEIVVQKIAWRNRERRVPNKSLQPTATLVTPPAAQEIVPSVAVAEH